MQEKANIFVICAPEISSVLHNEITQLGFTKTTEHRLGVQLYGSLKDCMYLNLHLRTANKVLWEAGRFQAYNPDQLYKNTGQIPWEDEIELQGYFNIDSYVKNDSITDSRFANLKLKDAIVDRFTDRFGKRPNTGPEKDKTRIYLHWTEADCIVYYDTSGGVIAKHGYRKIPGQAPMIESLAAAVILTSKWDRKAPFINPMCGSGTLAIEAALLATNTAPGLFRDNFGFMHLKSYDPQVWRDLIEDAKKNITTTEAEILASDLSEDAVSIAKINAKQAGMDKYIQFYSSEGKLLKEFNDKILVLRPMESFEYIVESPNKQGGPGASFIVNYVTKTNLKNPPFIESVMLGTIGNYGFAFTSPGINIDK